MSALAWLVPGGCFVAHLFWPSASNVREARCGQTYHARSYAPTADPTGLAAIDRRPVRRCPDCERLEVPVDAAQSTPLRSPGMAGPGRGGKRAGAGRPSLGGEGPRVPVTLGAAGEAALETYAAEHAPENRSALPKSTVLRELAEAYGEDEKVRKAVDAWRKRRLRNDDAPG